MPPPNAPSPARSPAPAVSVALGRFVELWRSGERPLLEDWIANAPRTRRRTMFVSLFAAE